MRPRALLPLLTGLFSTPAWAADSANISGIETAGGVAAAGATDAITLDAVTVIGRRLNLVGEAISASEGSVGQDEIASRPLSRPGDLLEFVPGLVATQHSGSGKANQYFLRGFNLDHGTDFATFVDAMPVNMRTHGHGQGYSDLNFVIPETVEELSYRKGPYYADVGDFSSAGSARFRIADTVTQGAVMVGVGQYGYRRGLLLDSHPLGEGNLLYAGEGQTYDGPWQGLDENVRKANVLLRYSGDALGGKARINAMGYRNRWNAPDQIPQRAVARGLISRFGQIDASDGGESERYSLSGDWQGPLLGGELMASAYAIDYQLRLWSNFTYFLDDPVNGDQFEQVDERRVYGFNVSQQWERGRGRWRVGVEGRFDDIDRVGLFHTSARRRLDTVREDRVEESSLGIHAAYEVRFNDSFRSYLGMRHDAYRFVVDSDLPENSGHERASRTSVKASVVYRPNELLEAYASHGTGFHSNDARGSTIRVDPASGVPAQRVDPLVGSRGAELGARVHLNERWQATLALWHLKLDSELLFVGDAGTTEASRPSRRDGVESGIYWFGNERWRADAEIAYTHARFTDNSAGRHIPGAIPWVVGAGITHESGKGWFATARLRHFGRYALVEDGSVEARASTMLNLRVGREWGRWGAWLDVINALDSDDHDIDYYFPSRLPSETGGVDDVHYHVFEPRSLRLSVRYSF